jgi:hypothetical protein
MSAVPPKADIRQRKTNVCYWAKSGPESLRADECRRLAESLHGAEARLKLLRIAADYDWMVMRAAAFELQ